MMFRDKSISKLYAYALAAVFALTLAGCGGGGGGSTAEEPEPMPMPTPQETCEGADGRFNADGSCTSAAEIAQEMIMAAQGAAGVAAAAANTALNAAKAAFNGIAGLESYDELHYGLVASAVGDAVNAKQAADNAVDDANGTEDVEAALEAQKDAERAQAAAEAALANAEMFAGAVTAAKTEADRLAEEERMRIVNEGLDAQLTVDLAAAVSGAMTANMAAAQAARDAAVAVGALAATEGVTVPQGIAAQAASDRASDAADAALSAHATAISAQNDRNLTAAQAAQGAAETAQTAAEEALGEITAVIAMLDEDIQEAIDEAQRVVDVGIAITAALGSATTADADAMKAEEAATRVEEIAAGTAAATNARTAATNARTAADAAQAAHDAITDDMSKEDADEQAGIAANQAMYANSGYMTASNIKDTTESNLGITQEENRKRDIRNATTAATTAATAAKSAADEADDAADAAESARDAARAANSRASSGRMDTTETKKQSDAANTAATAARAAANAAMQAYVDAKAAAESIDADGSATDAQTAQGTAVTKQGEAEDSQETAEMKQGDAETAKEAAVAAAGVHVLDLFKAANAQSETDTDDRADAVETFVTAINSAAGSSTDADNNSTTDTGGSTSTATAAFPADVAEDEATNTDAVEGMVSIIVSTATGVPLTFREEAVEATDDDAAMPKTATELSRGLGNFYGYEISDDGTHAIVFTDKKQGTPAVEEVTFVAGKELLNADVENNTVTKLGTRSGNRYTGVTYYEGTVTTDPDAAFMGTLTCPDGVECSAETDADGDITVDGFLFTGSRAERAAVATAAPAENEDYLVFGVWLQEDSNDDTEGTPRAFAAFANGGEPIANFAADYTVLTGTANYNGRATGVYTAGSSVDYFEGNASLTANFGAPGTDDDDEAVDDEIGTIKGDITSIVAGGVSMSDIIRLSSTPILDAGAAFSGNARMGSGVIQDDDTVKYPYNGSWSGNFYGANAAVEDNEDTANIDEEKAAAAPDAVAGTFGVTGTTGTGDDAVTRSYVGGFGARK